MWTTGDLALGEASKASPVEIAVELRFAEIAGSHFGCLVRVRDRLADALLSGKK